MTARKLWFGVWFMFSVTAFGRAPDYTIHQEYTSTRALGMGNAFVAVADDHSALFYNPAALYLRKDTQVRMFLRAGVDADYMGLVDDIDKAGDEPEDINGALAKHNGEHLYARVGLGGVIARPRWGMAIIPADISVDLALHESIASSIFVNTYVDTTIAYGRAYRAKHKWFAKNKLYWGWTAKVLHRAFYSDVVQAPQLASDQDIVEISKAAEGATVDLDLGLLYIPETRSRWFKPTFGMLIKNIADYGFPMNFGIWNEDPEEPPKLERRLDVGMKMGLPKFWVFDPKFAVDVRDIGHRNWNYMKGLHAGAEMYWKMNNWWQGHWSVGLNQGYMTAGFGARAAIFQIDLATWGEEVGTEDARRESRRYIAELSLDF